MKFGKTDSGNIEHTLKKAQNFEVTLTDARRKSEKRAWMVAGLSLFVSLCLLGGLFYILPLKEKVPYLVMADAYTGTSSVSRLSTEIKDTQITASEAINRSNISHFIYSRESYDSVLLGLRDWKTVYAMSTPDVSNDYRAWMNRSNPNSPFNVYNERASIRVKILSIVLHGGDPKNNITPKGATVRFQRFIYDKQSGGTRVLDNKIATLDFTYKSNLKMAEEYRVENPLGFQVSAYRVDSDVSTPAAPEDINPAIDGSAPTNSGLPNPNDPTGAATSPQPTPATAQPNAINSASTTDTSSTTPQTKGAQ